MGDPEKIQGSPKSSVCKLAMPECSRNVPEKSRVEIV